MDVTMDIQDLRKAFQTANQQISLLESYQQELVRRCEQLSMDPETDFTYITFKLNIMAQVKKLYELYRDIKQEQFQQQCSTELTQILHTPASPPHTEHTLHHTNSMTESSFTSQVWDTELDIHRVPPILSPIEDPVLLVDNSDFGMFLGEMDLMTDLAADEVREM